MSPFGRCALTAPFQPYPGEIFTGAVYFLLHFLSGRPALPLAGTLIHEVLGLSSPVSTEVDTAATVHPPRDNIKGTAFATCTDNFCIQRKQIRIVILNSIQNLVLVARPRPEYRTCSDDDHWPEIQSNKRRLYAGLGVSSSADACGTTSAGMTPSFPAW